MQKTIEGLLRSLLHSALLSFSRSDIPNKLETIKDICSLRSQIDVHSAWSRSALREMFIRLTSVAGVKFFFLVDALDECEPQDDLGDLVHEILRISNLPNVKICVSHRPWEIFTRNFEHAPTLRLDRLTLRDMETYVRGRLTSVEADVGRHSDFHDQTQPSEDLICDLANAAEGVFLWTELVTKATSSEMRKGKRIEQLFQVMADFPTDLDKYFHELVFGRIGKSNRNIKDTAAALKLAVKINTSEQNSGVHREEKSPFARSFMNFWLLSEDRLKPGFSWQEYECIVQPGTAESDRKLSRGDVQGSADSKSSHQEGQLSTSYSIRLLDRQKGVHYIGEGCAGPLFRRELHLRTRQIALHLYSPGSPHGYLSWNTIRTRPHTARLSERDSPGCERVVAPHL
jgi:hypothetical protein